MPRIEECKRATSGTKIDNLLRNHSHGSSYQRIPTLQYFVSGIYVAGIEPDWLSRQRTVESGLPH
jgi:hypothetical protein